MKNDTKSLIKLLKYYKKYKILCIAVIVLSLSYSVLGLFSPMLEGKLLALFENFNPSNILKMALVLVILRIIIEIVINLWSIAVLKLNGKVNFDLKHDMIKSLTNFELKNFDNTNSGIFISRLNTDTTALSELFDEVTDSEIIEVCKKARIHDDIMEMEKNYDTEVGENGVILSGGQKQRIAIARALIKKSKIILLDEATSALDNDNQEKIKNVIKDLSKNHTIIIVAHRLSTIVDADNIFVLDNHKIIANGTHEELMKKSLEYQKLYEKAHE